MSSSAPTALTPKQCIELLTAIDPQDFAYTTRMSLANLSTNEELALVQLIPDIAILEQLISFIDTPAFVRQFCRPLAFTRSRIRKKEAGTSPLTDKEKLAPVTDEEIAARKAEFLKQIERRRNMVQCKRCHEWRSPTDIHTDTGCCLHPPTSRNGDNGHVYWTMCCADKHLIENKDNQYAIEAICPVCGGASSSNRIRKSEVGTRPPLYPNWNPNELIDYPQTTSIVCGNCGVEVHRLDVPEPYRPYY